MRQIVMTAWRRPDYTRRVLESLRRCDGIERYDVNIRCEPDNADVMRLIQEFQLPNKRVTVNPHRLGCTDNTLRALEDGFDRSDYVVIVEDDVLLAPDALRWFEFAELAFRDDPSVFTAAAYRKEITEPKDDFTYGLEQWFTPWGWATWEDRFVEMRSRWGCKADASWDVSVNHEIRGDRLQAYPTLSRSQNIGGVGGTYCPGPEWHAANQFNPHWAGAFSDRLDESRAEFRPRETYPT